MFQVQTQNTNGRQVISMDWRHSIYIFLERPEIESYLAFLLITDFLDNTLAFFLFVDFHRLGVLRKLF